MSEQLWYTWSVNGLGRSNGLRVRAASAQLTAVEGQRVRNFLALIGYSLPEATDQFLPPDQAPLNLTFLKTGSPPETVLMQKAYTGLDGVKRPGAFFSHLITNLPEASSPVPQGRLPFSAREAIRLWRSSLWRDTELGWPPSKYDLPELPAADLLSGVYDGSLSSQSVHQLAALFPLAFEALLTLALAQERKRLYLVGEPDVVAALIWGMTHALPRTLKLMQELTFSTFEANVETDARPLIVGTHWQPTYLKKGYEQALLDLPAVYYQAENPYGIAIDCAHPEHHTPFSPHALFATLVSKYVRFAQGCFDPDSPGGMDSLKFLQDAAEKREITELKDFLQHYVQFHEILKEEDVTHILTTLYQKASTILDQIWQCLEQERLSEAIRLFSSLGTLHMEFEVVNRENVQRSLQALLFQKPDWWQRQGEPLLRKLFKLSHDTTKIQLKERGQRFVALTTQERQWQRSQGLDLLPALQAVSSSVGTDPRELLYVFTDMMELRFLETQELLKKALLPLVRIFMDQLVQTLEHDQAEKLPFWSQALEPYVAGPILWPEVWCHLFLALSPHLRFNATTQQWWNASPIKQYLSQFRSQFISSEQPELKRAFLAFADSLAQELAGSLRTENKAAMLFWNTLLQLVAPVKQQPQTWTVFLRHVGVVPYSSVYRAWYDGNGRQALIDFAYLARSSESSLRLALSTYLQAVANSLQAAILKNQEQALIFWHTLLMQLAAPETEPALWLTLLFALKSSILEPGFVYWWRAQGRHTTSLLRRLAEQKKLDAGVQLLPFAQEAEEQLAKYIREEMASNQSRYDDTIDFLLEVVTTALPAQDSRVWLHLLREVSHRAMIERCRWDLRARLLKSWKQVSALTAPEMLNQLAPWLKVSWQELDALLSLDLPEKWKQTAIHYSLESYHILAPDRVISIVTRHSTVFEDVLQSSMKSSAPPAVFFAFLAEYGYPRTIPLLDRLIQASAYQKEMTEQLLQAAHITTDQQIITLLEQHCTVLLASYELPNAMLKFIQRYLDKLDLENLGTDATRRLFERLRNRAQTPALRLPLAIEQTVESLYNVAAFLALPRATSQDLRILTRLTPEMQQKLSGRLIPQLVTLITAEAHLTRTLDALRPDDPLPLLEELIKLAGERYGHEDPPTRLAPYIRMLLTETRHLAQEERETFVNDCSYLLFKNVSLSRRDRYFPEALWPQELVDEWRGVSNFLDALHTLREEIRKEKPFIPTIADFYRPAFDKYHIDEPGPEVILLAKRFIAEYQVRNAKAMLQIHESLKRFYASPTYTQEQVDLMVSVQRRNPPSNSGLLPSMPFFPGPRGSNQAGPALPGSSGSSQQMHSQVAGASQQAAANAAQGQYNKTLLAPSDGMTKRVQIIAQVENVNISLDNFEDAYQVRKIYTQLRIEQNQRKVDRAENGKEPMDKKAIDEIKRDTKEMQKSLYDVMKLRQITLQELIEDIFIQQEIQVLGAREENNAWLREFLQLTEQERESTYTELQNAIHSLHTPVPLILSDPNDTSYVRPAIEVFVRRRLFKEALGQDTSGILKRIKEQGKTAKINNQLARKG